MDLTNGNIYKSFFRLCLPLYLSGLLTTGYNIADTAIVGKYLGKSALSGIGSAATVMFLMQGLMVGLCSGLCSLIAKSIGKNDNRATKQGAAGSLLITVLFSLLLTAAVYFLLPQILKLLNTQNEFYDYTLIYLRITVLGFPILSLYRLFESWLHALGLSYAPLWLCALALLLHIILDFLLVVYLQLGVAGAALTSVISFAVCAAAAFVYIIKKHSDFSLRRRDFKGCISVIIGQFKASAPMSVMQLSKGIGLVMIQSACNAQGGDVSAAFAVCSKLMHISTDASTALSNSSVSFLSQNHEDRARVKCGMRTAIIIGICFSALAGGVLIFASGPLSHLFLTNDSAEVTALVKQFFLYIAPFFAALSVTVVLRSALLSRSHPYLAMTEGIVELAVRLILVFFVREFSFVPLIFGISWTAGLLYLVAVKKDRIT